MPWAKIFDRKLTPAAAPVAVNSIDFLASETRVTIIRTASLRGSPGAGQAVRRLMWGYGPAPVLAATFTVIFEALLNPLPAANVVLAASWAGEVYVPPNMIIRAAIEFDAGAVNNTFSANYHGFQIPLGTLSIPQ